MSQPDRYSRAKAIFLSLYEAPSEVRRSLLDRQCEDDEALRRDVEDLLGSHEAIFEAEASGPGGALPTVLGILPIAPAWQTPASIVDGSSREVGQPVDGGGRAWQSATGHHRSATPARVGRFRILRELGRGASSRVYLAEDPALPDRPIALKVLRGEIPWPALLSRFHTEAEALRKLDHPGIVRFLELGQCETPGGCRHYIAMEAVDGRPLRQFAWTPDGRGRASDRGRIELLIDLCEAVAHAHAQGIIHRDLKPENILVDRSGKPKILDYGIARLVDLELRETGLLTSAGQVLGTLRYMSPEQARGDSGAVSASTDIYALGVIAYEMLAGCPPYEVPAATGPALAAILHAQPAPAGTVRPQLRGNLELVLERALQKDPQRRYRSALEMAEDLRRHLQGRPLAARAPHRWLAGMVRRSLASSGAPRSRNRRISLIATLALLLAATGIWLGRGSRNPDWTEARMAANLSRICSALVEGDRLRHHNSDTPEGISRSIEAFAGTERLLAAMPRQPYTELLHRYIQWRLGELHYFLGTREADPDALNEAIAHWWQANVPWHAPPAESLEMIPRPLVDRIARVGGHHTMAGLAIAHAALAFHVNPVKHHELSLGFRRSVYQVLFEPTSPNYIALGDTATIMNEDRGMAASDLAGSMAALGACTDSLPLLRQALDLFSLADTIHAFRALASPYGSFLLRWGTAFLERAERTGSVADADTALSLFASAARLRERDGDKPQTGSMDRAMARALMYQARRATDSARRRDLLQRAQDLLESALAFEAPGSGGKRPPSGASRSQTPQDAQPSTADRISRALFERSLATLLIDRVQLRVMADRQGRPPADSDDPLRSSEPAGSLTRAGSVLQSAAVGSRADSLLPWAALLSRADSLLQGAAITLEPDRLPVQAAEVHLQQGRAGASRWSLWGDQAARERALDHFRQAGRLLPPPHDPSFHRRISEASMLLGPAASRGQP